jgi:hypothetical protein
LRRYEDAIADEGHREVGRYRVLRLLGEGGMANVHLARDRDLDRLVALKEIVPARASDPEWTARFLHESRVIGSMKHPNIVTVFEYLERGGVPYIAMEYAERGSLRPYVGMLTLAQNAFVLEGVLAGLRHAERRGIVHRDLKPENLLVTEEGGVKIADFGIAKVAGELTVSLLRTAVGVTVGTPLYMAPEQAQALGDRIGPWTDLYAVGCIAYELFTGAPPFSSVTDPRALMHCHAMLPIPPAHEANGNVDRAVSRWIDSLLVKDPAGRVRSAAEAWETLEEIVLSRLSARWRRDAALPALEGPGAAPPAPARSGILAGAEFVSFNRPETPAEPLVDTPPGADTTQPPRTPVVEAEEPDRRRVPALLAGAAGLVVLALVAVLVLRGGDEPPPPAQAAQAPAPSTLAAGPLSVRLPAGWTRRPHAALGALALDGAVVAGPPDGDGTVVLGVGALSPTLLPEGLAGEAPEPAGETLAGGLSAYRYDGLDLGQGSRAVLYAVPTDAGVATVACRQPVPADEAFARACAGVARSLAITDAKAYPAGPDARYAAAAGAAVRAANRALGARGLRRAQTPKGQAAAVARFRGSLSAAAAALREAGAGPIERAPGAALAGALTVLAQGYGSLASAAEHGRRDRYDRASAKIRSGRAAAAGALADLRAAGYDRLPALAAARLAPLRRPEPKPAVTPAPRIVATPTVAPTVAAPATPRPAATPQSKYGPRKGTDG